MIAPIALADLGRTAQGVARPEDVQRAPDGRVFVSDAGAIVSEILADGSVRRVGAPTGGEPNGFTILADGATAVVADFAQGVLRRVDLETGAAEDWVSEVEGRPLGAVNYALADRSGAVWVSTSTRQDPAASLAMGAADGFIFRVDPDGTAALVADEVCWPNCMTFDDDERHLYFCRSAYGDVARAPVVDGTGLGAIERYGPPLGARRDDEYGMEHLAAFGQPEVLARWGLTDGCGFDADGNLWVTVLSANRIVAITPDQEHVVVIEDPEGTILQSPTSVAWAGDDLRDLYIGSLVSDYVVTARSPVAGRARG